VNTSRAIEIQRRISLSILRAPAPILRALVGPPRRSPEGFELDLQTQALLRLAALTGRTAWHEHGVERGRRLMNESGRILGARPEGSLDVADRSIPVTGGSIRLRIYTPRAMGDRPLPIVVYYHGGGFVLGSLDSHDGECRALAIGARAIVIAVDYRLAPEHRFPTPALDGLAAFRWAGARAASLGGDAGAMAVAGDSAGGNIAAVVARETRGDAVRPVFQLLVYPATDFTRSLPSHRLFRDGFLLTEEHMVWFLDQYLRNEKDLTDPLGSVLHTDDHAGVPPAMILTAGFDPLRDEGRAYADRLRDAGVRVTYRCHEGLVHGFMNMTAGVRAAARAQEEAAAVLRRELGAAADRARPAPQPSTTTSGSPSE
jgi:acetyl esterase